MLEKGCILETGYLKSSVVSLLAASFVLLDRGKSLPRLHKAHIDAKASSLGITLKPAFPLRPTQPNSIAVRPMKPPQGSTLVEKPQPP